MFTVRYTQNGHTERPADHTSRRTRLGRSIRVAVAVAVAIITVPLAAHAEPRPVHGPIAEQTDSPARPADAVGPDEAPLLDACPIGGPSTFEDSWGWPRSGGRRHEGVDIIAARGVPVVAVRDGQAQFKTNGLGGRAIWLTTSNGDRFYYAHLSDWEGESRQVSAGEVIGYVGSSGNAKGPHLHFETLPGGAVENPYPHTLGACVPPPEPVVNEIAQRHSSAALEPSIPHPTLGRG